ncbi:hypothetical protein [Rhizobium sp. R693]|uniref:hypothetical protein n=1 Tax=Rhizobium sp. R693 TaxID=1764276 RepID=UPI000B52F756|nr:hypothetical protein [Rhizobium sp. R693]OWV98152.1 hypothetical protein ATY79_20825 [Rhizobium sp. R693]
MISEDRYIEILAAAIQRSTIPEADVQWNVKIGNRQFDVLAKLKVGLHSVLIGYEVKNKSRPISVEAMDAFVTKARDAGINKPIFVSRSGFQSGAISVGKNHGIDLFRLDLSADDLPSVDAGSAHVIITQGKAPPFKDLEVRVVDTDRRMNVVETVKLAYSDGSSSALPDEPSQLNYYLERSLFSSGQSIGDLIDKTVSSELVPLDQIATRSVSVGDELHPPDDYFLKKGTVKEIIITVKGISGKLIESNSLIEPSVTKETVKYTNVIDGSSIEVPAKSLPVGDSYFKAGVFYFAYSPLRYFYCDQVSGDDAVMYLVESFQSATLFQAEFIQRNQYSRFYIEVTDKRIISRLQDRLKKMKSPQENLSKPKQLPVFPTREYLRPRSR